LLLDVRLPLISGLDLHKRLVAQHITLPVIILTGYGDVSMAVGAMKTGAFDFIEKPYNDQILIDRVQQAIEYDARLRREQAESQLLRTRLTHLTPREFEVMKQLVEGKANKVIARELGITYKTVEVHRARIMEKTQASNIVDLVHIASVCGMLPHEDNGSR
jgi:FixJ family two-component response regulator